MQGVGRLDTRRMPRLKGLGNEAAYEPIANRLSQERIALIRRQSGQRPMRKWADFLIPGDHGVRVVSRISIVTKSAGAEIIIAANAVSEFELSRTLNGGDFVGKVLEIVPDHKGSVILVRPGT